MAKNNEQRTYTTLDSYIAGFLLLRNHFPELLEQGQKIVFSFPLSEQLLRDLQDYTSGAMVAASQMAFACKSLKSQIHSIRNTIKEKDYGKEAAWR